MVAFRCNFNAVYHISRTNMIHGVWHSAIYTKYSFMQIELKLFLSLNVTLMLVVNPQNLPSINLSTSSCKFR